MFRKFHRRDYNLNVLLSILNSRLEPIIGLIAASILVKLLDKLIEKMCEYHDCRTLEDQEDEESATKKHK